MHNLMRPRALRRGVATLACAFALAFAAAPVTALATSSAEDLPVMIDADIPDDALLVSSELAQLPTGEVVCVEDGSEADEGLLGTPDTPPDPLSVTGGERFVPVTVGEARDALADGGLELLTRGLEDNEYGAYWGTYQGEPAFFMKNGKLFATRAEGVVDVSEWNYDIDWEAAKEDGVEGAIIRVGFGTTRTDYYAKQNIAACKRLGIPFGVYIYSYAEDPEDGAVEGRQVVAWLRELGVSPDDLDYPVYYDLEKWTWTGHTPPTDPEVYEEIVRGWISEVQAAGYTNVGVYSYTNYLYGPLDSSYIHSKVSWAAQYGASLTFDDFGTDFRGWQYTSSGKVAGFPGNVDLNAFGYAAVSDGVTGGGGGTDSTLPVYTGWREENGELYWYDAGVMARDKQVYDPGTDAWYWFDADGTMARDKDVFIPLSNDDRSRGKWVRYDAEGRMVKGEDYRYNGWYYLDPVTGEMAKGFRYVPSNGGKWVFYDYVTGQMAHGERYIDDSHGDEPGWMCFDATTGAVVYGWHDLPGKRVYYHAVTGRMLHGWHTIDGARCHFDEVTGAYLGTERPSEPSQGSGADLNSIVYVTRSGSKYHRPTCPTIQRSTGLRSMTARQAIAAGYGACKDCKPAA